MLLSTIFSRRRSRIRAEASAAKGRKSYLYISRGSRRSLFLCLQFALNEKSKKKKHLRSVGIRTANIPAPNSMEDFYFNIPLCDVKQELRRGYIECQKRGLLHSAKWLAEMNHGLSDVKCNPINYEEVELDGIDPEEYDDYVLAKSYYDVREYDRAAYFVRNCESSVPKFLYFYSTYMALEKRRLDSTTDHSNLNDTGHRSDLAELMSTLRAANAKGKLDGYGLYLYGVVLKSLNLYQTAFEVLVQAIRLAPMLWAAYVELSPLINEKEKLKSLHFGGHWMRHFFAAHAYIELHLNDEGIKLYEELQAAGFQKCVYVTLQLTVAYHHKRDVDKALGIFKNLQKVDPYCLDNVDLYSNLLYVKEMKTEMAQLAHTAVGINKYLPETCCVIGNYYSIRSDHQNAILYFQRALKLNPKYLSAWTLMGHEFMELKNTNAAIQSYRKAVEVNKRDYRAWYGLGQSYEILKMHYYSLYYFKIAHQLRPYDSRMLVALGETYENLGKTDNALRCYQKACNVGDIEGIAMYKMANLNEKLGDLESAVNWYQIFCQDERAAADKKSLFHAYITLANYFENIGKYEHASFYAYKCLESDDRKSEAKALLKTIENKRSGKPGTSNVISTAPANINIANADTSSDDDMDLELSDYKLSNINYLMSDVSGIKLTPTSSSGVATDRTAASDEPQQSARDNIGEMSLCSNDSTSSNIPTITANDIYQDPTNGQTETPTTTGNAGSGNSDANETQSMDISAISID